jgi:5-methylthioribose kinase
LLAQVTDLWTTFAQVFADLWRDRGRGDLYSERLLRDAPELRERAITLRLQSIWDQSVGFAACKMIRRLFGLAHVEDFEAITDPASRAACESAAATLARDMLLNRRDYANVASLIRAAREHA